MTVKNEKSPLAIFCRIMTMLLLVMIANTVLQWRMTDFWEQPIPLTVKLGVIGYEQMTIMVLSALLLLPAYLAYRFGQPLTATLLSIAGLFPVLVLLVAGWSFYDHFQRFIGVYAIQMILQDGGQLFNFLGKMPSAVNWGMISLALAIIAIFLLLTIAPVRLIWRPTVVLSSCSVAVLCLSAVTSLLWNKPQSVENVTDESMLRVLERVKESEFLMLSSRSGPFTEAASSLSTLLFKSDPKLGIDVERLERRQPDLLTQSEDITPYNVVYMLVESLHPDFLEAYGGDPRIMPTVNTLSRNSVVFNKAYAQASHSNYADVAAISGQYPLRSMNIHFYPKDPEYPKSLPYDMLEPHGYKTGLFSSQNERWGLMENYLSSDSIDVFSHVGSVNPYQRTVFKSIEVKDVGVGQKKIGYHDFMFQSEGNAIERLDGVTTDHAISWLQSLDTKDPFYLYFNFQASHTPFNALPDDFEPVFFTAENDNADKVREGHMTGMPIEYITNAYKDSLHYVDQNISRVVEQLKRTGQHDNTIYVISADTSIRLGTELMGNGGDLVPDVLRVPLVMSIPGRAGRETVSVPVEQIDIMPTVLGVIGVGPHPASQGVNVLENRNPERIVYAVAQTPASHQYSAIYKDWQLLHDFSTDRYIMTFVGTEEERALAQRLTESETDWLALKLAEWKNSQIAYYSDPGVHSGFYPPRYQEKGWLQKPESVKITESFED